MHVSGVRNYIAYITFLTTLLGLSALYFYDLSPRCSDNLSISKDCGERNDRDQDIKARAGNTSLVSGHLQHIWSFSVSLWGKKQPVHSAGGETEAGMCCVLQVHPSETIFFWIPAALCDCWIMLFLMIPFLLWARPWGKSQVGVITWGLILWEHRIKTYWDLYLILSFASDF